MQQSAGRKAPVVKKSFFFQKWTTIRLPMEERRGRGKGRRMRIRNGGRGNGGIKTKRAGSHFELSTFCLFVCLLLFIAIKSDTQAHRQDEYQRNSIQQQQLETKSLAGHTIIAAPRSDVYGYRLLHNKEIVGVGGPMALTFRRKCSAKW